uniref:CD209 antigen-like isoform X2 n=1 Tax=Scatophagus argus TaxID=75038 RepID=UPI001ED82773|nr:CD209 antigen-like isoform X2 [Scatophagus argus]
MDQFDIYVNVQRPLGNPGKRTSSRKCSESIYANEERIHTLEPNKAEPPLSGAGDRKQENKSPNRGTVVFLSVLCLLLLTGLIITVSILIFTNSEQKEKMALLHTSYNNLTKEMDELQTNYSNLIRERNQLENKLTLQKDQLQTSYNQLSREKDQLQTSYNQLSREKDQLQTSYNQLSREKDQLQTSYNQLSREKDQLQTSYNQLSREKDQLQTSYNQLSREKDQLQTSYNQLSREKDRLQTSYNQLSREKDRLQTSYNQLSREKDRLQTSYNQLSREKDQLQERFEALAKDRNDLLRMHQEWEYFRGSFYRAFPSKKTWQQSRDDCLQRGADLMIINSKEEQDFANKFKTYMWIGLTDLENEGTWKWVDGTRMTNNYWSSGEPNGKRQENCGNIKSFNDENSWNDEDCSLSLSWVCEKKLQIN